MNKKSVIIFAIIAVVIVVAGAAALWSGGDKTAKENDNLTATSSEAVDDADIGVPQTPETKQATEGWRSYENAKYRFGLLYPQELNVREYQEADGAMSATFEERVEGKGFQIYVTPYGANVVTQERFRLDLPSGVIEEPTEVVIDGVRGTIFWSKNSIMGDTREVWFINNGFLYEVVTYKQLDEWLGAIMQTWQFLD